MRCPNCYREVLGGLSHCPHCRTPLTQDYPSYPQAYQVSQVGQPMYAQGYGPMVDPQKRGFAIAGGVLVIIGGVFALIGAIGSFFILSWIGDGDYAGLFVIYGIIFLIAFPLSIIGALSCFRMKGRMWAMWGAIVVLLSGAVNFFGGMAMGVFEFWGMIIFILGLLGTIFVLMAASYIE
jgi:hypothetical protein